VFGTLLGGGGWWGLRGVKERPARDHLGICHAFGGICGLSTVLWLAYARYESFFGAFVLFASTFFSLDGAICRINCGNGDLHGVRSNERR